MTIVCVENVTSFTAVKVHHKLIESSVSGRRLVIFHFRFRSNLLLWHVKLHLFPNVPDQMLLNWSNAFSQNHVRSCNLKEHFSDSVPFSSSYRVYRIFCRVKKNLKLKRVPPRHWAPTSGKTLWKQAINICTE